MTGKSNRNKPQDQLSLTNPARRTAARRKCDKLATELSWQRFTSTVANFQLLQLHLTYQTCIWRLCWG